MVEIRSATVEPGKAEEQINYRTAGRKHGGKIAAGTTPAQHHGGHNLNNGRNRGAPAGSSSSQHPQQAQQPSIPSKLETVLFRGERERKAFGSRSLRFEAAREESCAGPGAYAIASDFGKIPVSWGKKGTSGFASISKRFVVRGGGGSAPGPGAYSVTGGPSGDGVGLNPNAVSQPSAAFVPKKCENPLRGANGGDSSLGPAAYDVRGDLVEKNAASAIGSSCFTNNAERSFGKVGREAEGPGPGTYVVEASLLDGARHMSRNFANPTAHKKVSVHPTVVANVATELTHADRKGDFVRDATKLVDKRSAECASYALPTTLNVGGNKHLNPNAKTVIVERSEMSGKKFEKILEARQEQRQKQPGPGAYNPSMDYVRPHVARGISALKATAPQRAAEEGGNRAPGPAYYKNPTTGGKNAGKKSFHLNLKSAWVS